MAGERNRNTGLCKPGCEPVSSVSKTKGSISVDRRGEYGWSFDRIFISRGQDKTLAQFEDEVRWKFWSNDAYLNLKKYLEKLDVNKKQKLNEKFYNNEKYYNKLG